MCDSCRALDEWIERYGVRLSRITDRQATEVIEALIDRLRQEKADLVPRSSVPCTDSGR
jgi:hypothetical protein